MVEIEWSDESKEDLDDIMAYFTKSSPQYANSFFERIHEALENIRIFPKMGRRVPESWNPQDRELIIQKYRLIYRFLEKMIR